MCVMCGTGKGLSHVNFKLILTLCLKKGGWTEQKLMRLDVLKLTFVQSLKNFSLVRFVLETLGKTVLFEHSTILIFKPKNLH